MTTQEIIARLDRVKRTGSGWTARCPAHEDREPSLSISEGEDGRTLLNCFAGCSFENVIAALGLAPTDLFAASNGDGSRWSRDDADRAMHRRGVLPETLQTFGVTADLNQQAWRIPIAGGAKYKRFVDRKPKCWWDRTKPPDADVYGLDLLLPDTSHVYLAEGEPDVWIAHQAGLRVVSFTGGVVKVPEAGVRALKDAGIASVTVVYDADEPGREGAQKAAHAIREAGLEVEIRALPDEMPPGSDLTNLYNVLGRDDEAFCAAVSELLVVALQASEPEDRQAREGEDAAVREDATLTDTGNSARLVELHGDRLRYVLRWGRWLWWADDEGHWIVDHGDVHVREAAKDVGSALKLEAAQVSDPDEAKRIFAFAFQSLNVRRISGMVDLARGIEGIPLDHEDLDSDGWLLGVQNGVVDLRTGELRPADPADLMTRQCPVPWDKDAVAPRWARAMEEWFPDPEVCAYVQRVAGSALVGAQRDHVFVIHYGGGGNGKGTYMRAFQRVLGPYAVEVHLSLLVETKYREHDTVKADLFRARLAVASETERRIRLAEASVKNLSGGDRIRARRMREDPWAFDPTHSLWLQTNHLPEIAGRDRGIWRRIRVVKWEAVFEDEDQDQELDDTLAAEAPGILRWLVEGCLAWQERGLDEPEAVIRETLAYRRAEDTFSRFAEDIGLVFRQGLEIQAAELQQLLGEWAEGEGIDPPRQEVGQWLKDGGARQRRQRWTDDGGKRRQTRFWVGVGVGNENHETAQTDALA